MQMNDKLIEYLKQKENPYKIKVENMNVTFEYSRNGKTIKDCIINILKQKGKVG